MTEMFALLVPASIALIVVAGIVADNWLRMRHGYAPQNDKSAEGLPPAEAIEAVRQVALLTADKERLEGKVATLEERIAVLERIATDPAERTAREIEQLREGASR